VNSQYQRVSRYRTCLVCGKPDWCSYTPGGKISFCARIINNADRVSRTGWGVFYHEKSLFGETSLPYPTKPPPKKVELAPIEIRDFAYRKLIELAPAEECKEIIDGEKGLRARKILDFENYGSLPKKRSQRRDLAKEIRRLVNQKFPEYVRQRKSSVCGLPGFWLDKTGNIQLWLEKDYSCPMLIVPYRAAEGLIQACQLRFMCRKPESIRYVWLSTPEKSENVGCGSPLHFAVYQITCLEKPLIITEGALKAATISVFKNDFDILASAGINCSHEEIVAAARFRPFLIAFDADYYENPYVARAIARLINSVLSDAMMFKIQPRIKILTWNPRFKGFDDALLQGDLISSKSFPEWLQSLSVVCRKEAVSVMPTFD
jgi:hypothetical protein